MRDDPRVQHDGEDLPEVLRSAGSKVLRDQRDIPGEFRQMFQGAFFEYIQAGRQ